MQPGKTGDRLVAAGILAAALAFMALIQMLIGSYERALILITVGCFIVVTVSRWRHALPYTEAEPRRPRAEEINAALLLLGMFLGGDHRKQLALLSSELRRDMRELREQGRTESVIRLLIIVRTLQYGLSYLWQLLPKIRGRWPRKPNS